MEAKNTRPSKSIIRKKKLKRKSVRFNSKSTQYNIHNLNLLSKIELNTKDNDGMNIIRILTEKVIFTWFNEKEFYNSFINSREFKIYKNDIIKYIKNIIFDIYNGKIFILYSKGSIKIEKIHLEQLNLLFINIKN